MSDQIIDMHEWFRTPAGQTLLDWERAQVDRAVADIFGYHALQLGLPEMHGLQANRMPYQWLGVDHAVPLDAAASSIALLTDYAALPFPANSLDMVLLPHALEFSTDPHATLREVERVLVPEGRVVICGLNPVSLWAMRQRRAHLYQRMGFGKLFLPAGGEFIGYWRMRDWLRLLGFEIEVGKFGCYRPAVDNAQILQRFEWMETAGARWWPIFGAAYFLVAVKRVRGMRLLGPAWKSKPKRVGAAVPMTHSQRDRKMPGNKNE